MKRIVVGITGASGVAYGIRLLHVLRELGSIEVHLVLSQSARTILPLETSLTAESVESIVQHAYSPGDLAAPISSGSFMTDGMVIVPCSMKTMSMVALSLNENLLVRAADVTLKERRKLVVVPRETPLHLGHLRTMTALAEIGGVILPPVPAFYHRPTSLDDIVDQTVGKILDQFGVEHELFHRWGEK